MTGQLNIQNISRHFLVSDKISPGGTPVGGPDDGGHVVQQDPGDVRVELEGVVGDLLIIARLVPLLVQLPEVVNPDLQPQLGAEDVHPDRGPPVRDVLQGHVRLQSLAVHVEIDLLRLRIEVVI